MSSCRSSRLWLVLSADLAFLGWQRPRGAVLVHGLAAPHRWVARSGTDAAVATLATAALWLVGAWLAVGLIAMLLGNLPGIAGATAQRLSSFVLPAAVRRLLAGATAAGVVLAPATAAIALPAPVVPSGASTSMTSIPPPLLPMSDTSRRSSGTTRAALPSPPSVVVRPGDSLWSIASQHVGATADDRAIATLWPRWYAVNRASIGPDPSLIRPGEVLQGPDEVAR